MTVEKQQSQFISSFVFFTVHLRNGFAMKKTIMWARKTHDIKKFPKIA